MGMLLMAIVVYFGIMLCVALLGKAYAGMGFAGVIIILLLIVFCAWLFSQDT